MLLIRTINDVASTPDREREAAGKIPLRR